MERAKGRFKRILDECRPNKVLVFTKKGLPDIEVTFRNSLESAPQFKWGWVETSAWKAPVFGLRHPQGAKKQLMTAAVQEILGLRCQAP